MITETGEDFNSLGWQIYFAEKIAIFIVKNFSQKKL